MIKAILFDCFGVLTADTWKEFTATLPEEQRAEASELNRQYGAAYIDKEQFLAAIEELTSHRPDHIDRLIDQETTKNSQLLEYIEQLKNDYKIGLVSNVGSNWIRQNFLTEDEQKLFDNFILSYEVRVAKPDPEIFRIAADRLNVELDQCLLVDDVPYYCQVAESIGMKTVCYVDFQQARTDISRLLPNTKY